MIGPEFEQVYFESVSVITFGCSQNLLIDVVVSVKRKCHRTKVHCVNLTVYIVSPGLFCLVVHVLFCTGNHHTTTQIVCYYNLIEFQNVQTKS